MSGSHWKDETAICDTCTHYGVDVAPSAGDTDLYAPWEGRVVSYDDCDDCPEGEGNTYNEPDPFLADYDSSAPEAEDRRGNRVDPAPLFNLP